MDVRCEKCQTEYELDEARLKPGGVTVKCTNCGHMFKIRKRSNTNAGTPAPQPTMAGIGRAGSELGLGGDTVRQRPVSSKPPGGGGLPRNDDDPTLQTDAAPDRMWLIRLENGEQKSCRELATLQQWIIAGVVTRDSLISRSGKTWKSLGDIAELQQYFVIAEEARETRQQKPTKPPAVNSTMVGHSGGLLPKPSAGDDDEARSTGTFKARRPTTQPPPPPLASTKTPPLGSPSSGPPKVPVVAPKPPAPPAVNPLAQTMAAPERVPAPVVAPPPPAVPAKPEKVSTWAAMPERPQVDDGAADGPRFGGKIAAIPDEPAFAAGRVRVDPADESSFRTGKVRMPADDDDDDVVAKPRGSRAGLWITLIVLLLGGGGAAAYFLVIKKAPATAVVTDAGSDVAGGSGSAGSGSGSGSGSAALVVAPDAAITQPADPLDAPKKALAEDVETRLRDTMKTLADQTDPEALGLRAHVAAQLAQDLLDRAGLVTDKAEAEALRKESHTIVIDAATSAQKSHKAKPESGVSNLAMAEVLRLQSKRAADIKRYLEAASADKTWRRDANLAVALVLARDGKLEDAKTALAAIDGGDGKLETSGDVRARFHLALIAFAQNKAPDAKQLVQQVLAAQPEHAAARVLASRLETVVASSDPLPPEDHGNKAGSGSAGGVGSGSAGSGSAVKPPDGGGGGGGGSYDSYMTEANKVADTNCSKALELYQKAVDIKPDSAEAHTGMGYCFIESKQFSSAQSKFRTALRFAPKYEPAMFGIAEAYQQQGRKDDAIDAFKQYLAMFPGTPKAIKALERLGVTDPSGAGSATPPQNPTPPPPPPTPPPAEGAGSGSG